MIYLHLVIAIIQIAFVVGYRKEIAFKLIDKLNYKNLEKRDLLSADVMELYIKALEYPVRFTCDKHLMRVGDEAIYVWIANTVTSREFYTHDEYLKPKVDEMNKKLSMYDKRLLDKLCVRVKEGELHLINTFFEA